VLKSPDRRTVVRDTDLAVSNEYDAIVERLKILHPTLDALQIRVAVEDATQQFEQARLRMFVPLLVEKIADDECRRKARG
jgi:hypothetical protein